MTSVEVISSNNAPLDINLKAKSEPAPAPEDNIAEDPNEIDAAFAEYNQPQIAFTLGDPATRQSLIAKIQAHFSSDIFGPEVAHLNCDMSAHSVEQLENLLAQINQIESKGASADLFRGMVYKGNDVLESILISRNWKAQGWNASLQANPAFQRSLERIRLKYAATLSAPPEIELLALMSIQLQAVHAINTRSEMIAAQKEQLNNPIDSKFISKNQDL